MGRNRLVLATIGLGLVTASPLVLAGQSMTHPTALHDYRLVEVANGLETPWSIAFLPGGDMLVTERPGRLRIIRDGHLLPDPVAGVPAVLASGTRGNERPAGDLHGGNTGVLQIGGGGDRGLPAERAGPTNETLIDHRGHRG